jgi:hypothetical protein
VRLDGCPECGRARDRAAGDNEGGEEMIWRGVGCGEVHRAGSRPSCQSPRFEIEPHEAPVEDFPIKPSRKDGSAGCANPT